MPPKNYLRSSRSGPRAQQQPYQDWVRPGESSLASARFRAPTNPVCDSLQMSAGTHLLSLIRGIKLSPACAYSSC